MKFELNFSFEISCVYSRLIFEKVESETKFPIICIFVLEFVEIC